MPEKQQLSDSEIRLAKHYQKLLKATGISLSQRQLPKEFRNEIVAKSKKGRLGQIVVRRVTGLAPSQASKTMLKLQEKAGEDFREEIAEKLEAVSSSLPKEVAKLLSLLKDNNFSRKKSLARIVAEAGADPAQVIKKYAEGAIELGKLEVAIEAHQNMPAIVKDLVRHSLDKEGICKMCGGTGSLVAVIKTEASSAPIKCSTCGGTGVNLESSDHKRFAVEKLMEITEMVRSKAPQQVVNVGIQTNVGGGMSFMEKISKIGEEVVFKRSQKPLEIEQSPPIEAEIVEKDVVEADS